MACFASVHVFLRTQVPVLDFKFCGTKLTHKILFSKSLRNNLDVTSALPEWLEPIWSEVRDCGKLIQSLKERGI